MEWFNLFFDGFLVTSDYKVAIENVNTIVNTIDERKKLDYTEFLIAICRPTGKQTAIENTF